MGLASLKENEKFGSLKFTIDYPALFTTILESAIDETTMFQYFFTEIKGPLRKYMEIAGTAIQPKGKMDWPATWKEMREQDERTGISFLFCNSVKAVIRDLLLPFRDGRAGTREDRGDTQKTRSTTFREELHIREASKCPITGVLSDASTEDPAPGGFKGPLEGAHIIPHHLTSKTNVYTMIKNFAGKNALKDFSTKSEHVSNGILMDVNCHKAFDKLQWSIQATSTGLDTYEYTVRRTRPHQKAPDAGLATSHLTEGKKLVFGATSTLAKPNPEYCNLHLAVAGVAQAVGMAEILDVVDRDDDYEDFMAWLNRDVHIDHEQPQSKPLEGSAVETGSNSPPTQARLGSGAPPGDVGIVGTILPPSKPGPSGTSKTITPLPATTPGYGPSSKQPPNDKINASGRPRSDSCGSETHKDVKENTYNQNSIVY